MPICRFLLALIVISLLSSSSPAQLKPLNSALNRLDHNGVTVGADLYQDIFAGRDAHRGIYTWPVFLDFNTRVALSTFSPLLDHATFYSSLHANETAGNGFVIPIQAISGIEADSGVRLAEIWAEYTLDKRVSLRAGKIDANRDFAFVENGASFLNATAGYTPAFVTLPNYNDSRPGIEFLVNREQSHFNAAIFSPIEGTGVLLIGEFGQEWNPRGWNGRIAGGIWNLVGQMPLLGTDGTGHPEGVYFVAEQKFWRQELAPHGQRSLSAYMQWGDASREIAPMPRQIAFGVIMSSPFSTRTADAVGTSCSRGLAYDLAQGRHARYETAWELFYRLQFTKELSLTPDLQYIAHPGATHSQPSIALGLRLAMNLRPQSE